MNTIDTIFEICAAAAVVGLTALLITLCGAVIYGTIRVLFGESKDEA